MTYLSCVVFLIPGKLVLSSSSGRRYFRKTGNLLKSNLSFPVLDSGSVLGRNKLEQFAEYSGWIVVPVT